MKIGRLGLIPSTILFELRGPGCYGPGAFMRNPAMAVPAPSFIIDAGHGFGVAALAIFLHHPGAVVGEADVIGYQARMEGYKILCAVNALPYQVPEERVIGQVAVHALDLAVLAGVKPGLVFRIQHVATAAELRAFGLGVESRGTEEHE